MWLTQLWLGWSGWKKKSLSSLHENADSMFGESLFSFVMYDNNVTVVLYSSVLIFWLNEHSQRPNSIRPINIKWMMVVSCTASMAQVRENLIKDSWENIYLEHNYMYASF